MICKECEKQQHYCTSCGTDGYSEDGFCSLDCKYKHCDYDGFEIWWRKLRDSFTNTFDRKVIIESKEDLWESWVYLKTDNRDYNEIESEEQ